MHASRRLLARSLASLAIVALGFATPALAIDHLLPGSGMPAAGIRVDGENIPADCDLHRYLDDRATRFESRQVQLVLSPATPPTVLTLRQLGVRVDAADLERRVLAVAHTGSLEQRIDQALDARDGHTDIPITWHLDPSALLDRMAEAKDDLDRLGSPARFDFAAEKIVPHVDGRYLDAFATLDALDGLARGGGDVLRAVYVDVPPFASEQLLRKLDITQVVGHYETRFGYLGGQADRAHNIATAAARLDGVVMLPSQILSFNRLVGHRTLENGFRKGWEIFKGEMVQGVGGGTCQVASTLHAAAFLAGFDIVDRAPHSRPSAYIPLGLDATVVDGLVDLKLRNPFPFPVVLHSVVKDGSITFELRGEQRPAQVSFRGDVVGVQPYKRKITEASWLAQGHVLRKQRGIRGYRVRKTRSVVLRDGTQREDVTTDVYPPTTELLLVPPGTDESTLPPLPFAETSAGSSASDQDPTSSPHPCATNCPAPPVIEDTPEARHSAPADVHPEIVIQR